MAKHSTIQTIKFKRLVRDLNECEAHVLGHLEMMWQHAHTNNSPVFETLDDVELAAGWDGQPGSLADALVKSRWLDLRKDGKYECHDYLDHAPYYVIDRMRKRESRGNVLDMSRKCPGQVQDKSRTCHGMSSPPTDTDTDTDTLIADTDRSSLSRARGGQPEALGALSASAIDGMLSGQYAEWWRRVSALVEPYALGWWRDTMTRYLDSGGSSAELEELVSRFEDASNPAIRDAKGIGEFTDAPRAMMKAMTRLCKRIGVRWQTYPSGVRV